jgi:hypothetical protein
VEPVPPDAPTPPPIPASSASPPPLPTSTPTPPTPPPAGRDPEFDPVLNTSALELDHSPESYQRLVANPFLGFFAIVAWMAVVLILFQGIFGPFTPMAAILMLAALALLPPLFQYHCLDCGATGRLTEWRRHMCPSVAERRLEGRTRRIRGPAPPIQVLLWLWVLMALIVAAAALEIRPARFGILVPKSESNRP